MLKIAVTLISLLSLSTIALADTTKDACADKQQGDLCSYTDEKDNDFNGSCQLDANKTLVCQANN